MRKLSQEEAIKHLYEKHPNFNFSEFVYNGGKEKGKVTCDKGHSWYTSYGQLTSKTNHGCPICSGNKKLTQEEAIKNLKKKHPNYDFSKFIYKNARIPSTVICEKGHIWEVCYYSSVTGIGCPKCSYESRGKNHRLNVLSVIENLQKAHPDFDFSEFEYTQAKGKGKVKCSNGHIWYTSYEKLMLGRGCLECFRRNQIQAIEELKEKRPDYDFSHFIYKNAKTKSTVICDKGHRFQIKYSKIMEGVGCPHCQTSKGEIAIKNWLSKNNIEFEQQKTFEDAKYKLFLRWDFYLPQFNTLIEYNGRQHYEFVGRWHKDLIGFRVQLERDMLKEKYAKEHKITQLIISYNQFKNIDEILSDLLLK